MNASLRTANCELRTARRGFTLIELMVAMALTVLLMAILSEAFVKGLESFRLAKGLSDLDRDLLSASSILRKDLKGDHFEADKRLSLLMRGGQYDPPEMGMFHYREVNPALPSIVSEGPDAQGLVSYRDMDDSLHFTVRSKSNLQDEFSFAALPMGSPLAGLGAVDSRYQRTGMYASQWAEVIYFLAPSKELDGSNRATFADGSSVRLPLFNLYRRQRLLVPEFFTTGTGGGLQPRPAVAPPGHENYDVSVWFDPVGMQWEFNSALDLGQESNASNPADFTYRKRRFGFDPATGNFNPGGYAPIPATPMANRAGADLLIANVLSFDVKGWNGSDFVDLAAGYDAANPANNQAISALQIKLRVWDPKTRQAREVTIIQDM